MASTPTAAHSVAGICDCPFDRCARFISSPWSTPWITPGGRQSVITSDQRNQQRQQSDSARRSRISRGGLAAICALPASLPTRKRSSTICFRSFVINTSSSSSRVHVPDGTRSRFARRGRTASFKRGPDMPPCRRQAGVDVTSGRPRRDANAEEPVCCIDACACGRDCARVRQQEVRAHRSGHGQHEGGHARASRSSRRRSEPANETRSGRSIRRPMRPASRRRDGQHGREDGAGARQRAWVRRRGQHQDPGGRRQTPSHQVSNTLTTRSTASRPRTGG